MVVYGIPFIPVYLITSKNYDEYFIKTAWNTGIQEKNPRILVY